MTIIIKEYDGWMLDSSNYVNWLLDNVGHLAYWENYSFLGRGSERLNTMYEKVISLTGDKLDHMFKHSLGHRSGDGWELLIIEGDVPFNAKKTVIVAAIADEMTAMQFKLACF